MRLTVMFTAVILAFVALGLYSAYEPADPIAGHIALGVRAGGAGEGGHPPWNNASIDSYTRAADHKPDFVLWFQSWGPRSDGAFPTAEVEELYQRGYTQVITWVPQDYTTSARDPEYSLDTILLGRHDDYIRQYARDVAAWGRPVYLRPFHEMNGDWNAYGAGKADNTPQKLVLAWRRVHRIFDDEGATNVKWVWSPNVGAPSYRPQHPMTGYYPGDAYVDWLGLDGYNWGGARDLPWYSFDELYSRSYDEITAISSKPLMIAEVASHTTPGDKAAWITRMRKDVPEEHPRIKAVSWFDQNTDGGLWRMDTSAATREVYRAMAADERWQGRLP